MKTIFWMILGFYSVSILADDKILNVHGFIDPQIQVTSNHILKQGFVLNDSALILSKEISSATFQLDLPFSGGPLAFNSLKSQAYVGYAHSDRLSWKLGKFDAPIGVESNKATQIEFTRQGLTYSLLPTSLTGATIQYSFEPSISLAVIVADPRNSGVLSGGSYDLGGRLDLSTNTKKFWIAGMYNADSNIGTIFDFGATLNFSESKLDLGFSYFITAPLNYGSVIAKWIASVSTAVDLGARLEFSNAALTRSASVSGHGNTVQATIGPQWRLTDELKMKIDYSPGRSALDGESSRTTHTVNLACVFGT